ncbi:sugar phosphate isomerase/epimerase [Bradyrhizobium sp. CIAT3101]|uniref:sugar phosphate isomerase/epimerase family protein n=1 Tax=Bradyrhizobium sp. CIAT3101 TaxID=439387 RepID=UPI0024B17A19|nr:sugar phosphate isomerase/epimerase [Bradyrhizobium sp. CIAT3101]WFU77264.1 sugar phosphate isomerase/epimerase [Bradyrhizobium sp. CIAT3101]
MASFSLAALTVLELAPPEMIALAARCGYEKVGLRLLPATPGGIAYRLMDDAPLLRETLARLQATGVSVADLEVVAFRPETDVASFTPFFETGARLGARHILVAAYDPDLTRFSDRYHRFCEAAAAFGLTSDLEFMPWTSVPDLKTAMRIVADVDHPSAGILVDALHFDRSQSSLADLRTIPAHRLHYWQLCDGPTERPTTTEQLIHAAREERMFPGEGGIDLVELTRAIPDDLTISIEVPTVQLAKTVDAETRARRALAAGKAVVERARAKS